MTKGEGKVLVEEVLQKLAHTKIRPTTMDQEQSFKVSKPGESKVARQNSLLSFLTTNTNTDVSS